MILSAWLIAYASMIPAGVCASGWGLWAASHADAAWLRWVGAAVAPAGVLMAALGTLLFVIPDFLQR